jgi:hypothetical protein
MTERIHTLLVELHDGALVYKHQDRERDEEPPYDLFAPHPFDEAVARELATRVFALLESHAAHVWEAAGIPEAELRSLGSQLYDKVFPKDLARKLRRDTSRSYLVLNLLRELVWIPWELLWDGKQFLSGRFRLARQLQWAGTERGTLEAQTHDQEKPQRALIILGDTQGLQPDEEKRAVERAFELLYGQAVSYSALLTAPELLERLKDGYWIMHFVGHGQYYEGDAEASGWRCYDGSILTCRHIERVAGAANFPFLIFANACDSARTSLKASQEYIEDLYLAFLNQGVSHYIGTLARVPDAQSREFTQAFYEMLAAGASVGEALAAARCKFSEKPGPPIWAYYVHYGDPKYRFVKPAAAYARSLKRSTVLLRKQVETQKAEIFVDRYKELAEARKHLTLLAEGKPSILLITGEAGSGKTAFLRHFIRDANREMPNAGLAIGTCQPRLGTAAEPYLPFIEIGRSLICDPARLAQPQPDAHTVGEFVTAELFRSFPVLVPVFRLDQYPVEELRRVRERIGSHALQSTVNPDQATTCDELARLFRRISEAVPLVLAVDDLHRADDLSLALFSQLCQIASESSILLVGTYRSHLTSHSRPGAAQSLRHALNEARRYGGHTISLDLVTATNEDRRRIISFVIRYLRRALPINFSSQRPGIQLVNMLTDFTRGNAFFLTQLLKHLQDSRQIGGYPGCFYIIWELATWGVEDIELPESVRAVLEERVAALEEDLRQTLLWAAVEGKEFTGEVLARVLEVDEATVLDRLEKLARIHLLVEECEQDEIGGPPPLFRFRNKAIHKYVHGALSSAQQRQRHKIVGECLEDVYPDKRSEITWQLFRHFYIACEWEKAVRYAIEAVRARIPLDPATRHYWLADACKILHFVPNVVPNAETVFSELDLACQFAYDEAAYPVMYEDWRYYGRKLRVLMSEEELTEDDYIPVSANALAMELPTSLNTLAMELGVKTQEILDALASVGISDYSYVYRGITPQEAEHVRQYFAAPKETHPIGPRPDATKLKFDLSHISKPGDVLRLIQRTQPTEPPPLAPSGSPEQRDMTEHSASVPSVPKTQEG